MKNCKEVTVKIKENFSKTSQDAAAGDAIKALMPKLWMSGSLSQRKEIKYCDVSFLNKHTTQFELTRKYFLRCPKWNHRRPECGKMRQEELIS